MDLCKCILWGGGVFLCCFYSLWGTLCYLMYEKYHTHKHLNMGLNWNAFSFFAWSDQICFHLHLSKSKFKKLTSVKLWMWKRHQMWDELSPSILSVNTNRPVVFLYTSSCFLLLFWNLTQKSVLAGGSLITLLSGWQLWARSPQCCDIEIMNGAEWLHVAG